LNAKIERPAKVAAVVRKKSFSGAGLLKGLLGTCLSGLGA